ncbi:hypothetical protein FC959_16550 [Clostridium botulinum]|nr:hypothetical protein [Clostridium botulinum]
MKPILFNTAMVQAILEGRKTCTRRVVKGNVKDLNVIGISSNDGVNFNSVSFGYGNINDINSVEIKERVKAPYMPGDILYIRETWKQYEKRMGSGEQCHLKKFFGYKADEDNPNNPSEFYEGNWKPSIHMPKDAARIFLKVTDVRVERLSDMEEEDYFKEGVRTYTKDGKVNKFAVNEDQYNWKDMPRNIQKPFFDLWNSTLKKEQLNQYGWNANPWVWVIEFERCEKSVDK